MPKQRTRICIEGWYYLMVLAFIIGGAVMREINLLLFVAGILIGPLVISWRIVGRSLQQVSAYRKLPAGISAGEMLIAEVTVTNGRRKGDAWGVTVEDCLKLASADVGTSARDAWVSGESVRVFFPKIAAQATNTANYQGRLDRRGRYEVGPLMISTRFPLGLMRRTITMPDKQFLYVYPRMGRMTAAWMQMVQPSRIGSRRSQQRQGSREGEFHSLRDHRSGDSQRWIHWRTTARRNRLTVKQFERQQSQNLELLLDLWVPNNLSEELRAAQQRQIEQIISFAATVCADHCRRGSSRLLLGVAGANVETVGGVTSMGLLEECLEKLAVARASETDRLPGLLDDVLTDVHPESRVVVLSPRQTDLSDTERFESIWQKPRERSTLGRVLCLPASSPEFRGCFELQERVESKVRNSPAGFHVRRPA